MEHEIENYGSWIVVDIVTKDIEGFDLAQSRLSKHRVTQSTVVNHHVPY